MALSAATIFECASLGSDGNAGSDAQSGGFNPTNAASITDLTTDANTGNTASPVVSSATYTFLASDVSHWCFIQGSGTWTLPATTFNGVAATPTGIWVKIASVAGGKATLSAAIGASVLYATGGPFGVSTAVGISTQVTPTGGLLLVDYSQCGTPRVSVADAVTAGTTTITSATAAFSKVMPGNLCYVTGGTGAVTAAVYEIATDTNTTTIVVDRSTGLTAGTGTTLKVGGCLASPGMAGAWHVAGNHIFVKNATYSVTSASTNISGGCMNLTGTAAIANQTAVFGYSALRTDAPKTTSRPTLVASGINTFALITMAAAADTTVSYLILDGAALTSSRAITSGGGSDRAYYVTAKNCTNSGFSGGIQFACDATGCSTNAAFVASASVNYCAAWSNTTVGFGTTNATNYFCLSVNNSGASSDGFESISGTAYFIGCTAYGNGRDGFRLTSIPNGSQQILNCISYGNTGVGFNATSATDIVLLVNCAAGSNSTNFASNITNDSMLGCFTLTADPFINAAGGNFGLNPNGANYGQLHAGGVIGAFPGLPNTVASTDIGGTQSGGSSGGQIFGDG